MRSELEALRDDEPDLLAGRYRLFREVGRGGMGIVHHAYDTQLNREVAIKMMNAGVRVSLRAEAGTGGALSHPNILPVYEVAEDFIVMQYVGGTTLAAATLSHDARLKVLETVARAVAHAHARGVVHGDLSPRNVMIERDHVYVVDFGLAVRGTQPIAARGGTPGYRAPDADVGPHSDVWSLGAMLRDALSRGDASSLHRLSRRAMSVDAAERPSDAGVFAEEMARALSEPPPKRSPVAVILGLVACVVAAVCVVVVAYASWRRVEAARAEQERDRAQALEASGASLAVKMDAALRLRRAGEPVPPEVETELASIVSRAPSSAEPYAMAALYYRIADDESRARAKVREALRLDPSNVAAQYEELMRKARADRATASVREEAARLVATGRLGRTEQLVARALSTRDDVEAMELLSKAAEDDRCLEAGELRAGFGGWAERERAATEGLTRDKGSAWLMAVRARARSALGIAGAMADAEEALRRRRLDPEMRLVRAEAHRSEGELSADCRHVGFAAALRECDEAERMGVKRGPALAQRALVWRTLVRLAVRAGLEVTEPVESWRVCAVELAGMEPVVPVVWDGAGAVGRLSSRQMGLWMRCEARLGAGVLEAWLGKTPRWWGEAEEDARALGRTVEGARCRVILMRVRSLWLIGDGQPANALDGDLGELRDAAQEWVSLEGSLESRAVLAEAWALRGLAEWRAGRSAESSWATAERECVAVLESPGLASMGALVRRVVEGPAWRVLGDVWWGRGCVVEKRAPGEARASFEKALGAWEKAVVADVGLKRPLAARMAEARGRVGR